MSFGEGFDWEQYNKNLEESRKEFIKDSNRETFNKYLNGIFEPDCLHNSCPKCKGTGIMRNGGMCIHGFACPCSRCSVRA